jgi:hypothetical protein
MAMKKWVRGLLVGTAITVALGAGAITILPPLLWGDGADYSKVVSIKTTREYQDAALLEKAWALPVAREYRPSPDHEIDYQKNGSFCGPTSVVNVARSLHKDADQASILADTGIQTTLGMLPGGITLEQLASLAERRTGKKASILRGLDLATFRQHLVRSNDPAVRYTANFHRGPLFGKGGGHHSPIAGYLADEDLVFVLDVNRSYRPWLVKPERLLEAMNTFDKQSGQKRGLLVLE